MVRMHVYRVAVDQRQVPLVLLADEPEELLLPIWVGPFEAQAIALELRGQVLPRPMTHDLLRSVIETLGFVVEQVAVTRLESGTFYAELALEGSGRSVRIDARPSDAIALALRAKAAIYVSEEVLTEDNVILLEQAADGEEIAVFSKLLDGLGLSDDADGAEGEDGSDWAVGGDPAPDG